MTELIKSVGGTWAQVVAEQFTPEFPPPRHAASISRYGALTSQYLDSGIANFLCFKTVPNLLCTNSSFDLSKYNIISFSVVQCIIIKLKNDVQILTRKESLNICLS